LVLLSIYLSNDILNIIYSSIIENSCSYQRHSQKISRGGRFFGEVGVQMLPLATCLIFHKIFNSKINFYRGIALYSFAIPYSLKVTPPIVHIFSWDLLILAKYIYVPEKYKNRLKAYLPILACSRSMKRLDMLRLKTKTI